MVPEFVLDDLLILYVFYRGLQTILHDLMLDTVCLELTSHVLEFLHRESLTLFHLLLVVRKVLPLNFLAEVSLELIDQLPSLVFVGVSALIDEVEVFVNVLWDNERPLMLVLCFLQTFLVLVHQPIAQKLLHFFDLLLSQLSLPHQGLFVEQVVVIII